MELYVLLEPKNTTGYRATSGEPLSASAEGSTREEALHSLRTVLESRFGRGVELVRLRIGREVPVEPIWPDDELTREWLAGIAEARAIKEKESKRLEAIVP